jgi:hypothetical protein
MLKGEETYWICLNPDCGKTATCKQAERKLETRVRACGNLMKKETHATVFSYPDFLKGEESSETKESKEKEETPCEK